MLHRYYCERRDSLLLFLIIIHMVLIILNRNRSDEYKSELVADFGSIVLPLFKSGELVPVVDRIVDINWNNESDIEKVNYCFVSY